jgi:hypothetical protein
MGLDPSLLAEFREDLRRCREQDAEAWAISSRLVGRAHLQTTIPQLLHAIETSSQPMPVRKALLACFHPAQISDAEPLSAAQLKQLTGLPTHKALRALCVLFAIAKKPVGSHRLSSLTPTQIEEFVRTHNSPYELLLESDAASLLDLGAGDLSFAVELAEQYAGRLRTQHRELTLHCIERLKPGSKLGSVLHADHTSLQRLQRPTPGLRFRFWGGLDMFNLNEASDLCPRYTTVTCHAPPTPTFAYEPTRLSHQLIQEHLRRTKGDYRKVRVEGEEALEVMHDGRSLLFPAWKFEVRGPLALLDLIARTGQLCVLSAMDTEVFWETLSQLVADERMRPRDVLFTPSTLPEVFGTLYAELSQLPIGTRLDLSKVTDLRPDLPHVLPMLEHNRPSYRFRYVELRRGAVFEGIPASRTARVFKDMPEEAPPWFLVLIPGS